MQAIVPDNIHPERYSADMASPGSLPAGWSAYPLPSSIILYQPVAMDIRTSARHRMAQRPDSKANS